MSHKETKKLRRMYHKILIKKSDDAIDFYKQKLFNKEFKVKPPPKWLPAIIYQKLLNLFLKYE